MGLSGLWGTGKMPIDEAILKKPVPAPKGKTENTIESILSSGVLIIEKIAWLDNFPDVCCASAHKGPLKQKH